MANWEFSDKRHSARNSGLPPGYAPTSDPSLNKLRERGFVLPTSNTQARIQAKRVVSGLRERGTATDVANKAMMASMRGATGGTQRTAANTQMVLPKVRQPLASLMDKGIPFNVQDPDELMELRRWCRLFFATHPLVPLLIDIYSKFPVMGLEFQCNDPKVEKFMEEMFMDDLNYEEFLPDGLMREYFMVGEVTALAHFNEELGIWSSEEILNPDMIRVSKSLFVEQERVQLLVKDLVESLRNGPGGMSPSDESPSEKFERTWEYQQLTRYYPEIIAAAAQDDGLDISDAIVSRMVNKAAWWDLRGTPHLLRSFRTLMLEESLNAAQDAVCDRLYAPMILATLGIQDMGDGECWIPDQGELEDLRDDIQSALAADFKLLCHNFGLEVTSVFGRESVPRFDTDYDRIDAQLMQAWGIGQGLIMGGSGDTYAGTAINREVCEQLMKSAQNKVIRHMRKRMEIVAEAQEFYDFELKGGRRVPIYESIVDEDPETGEERTIRVPKLLIPEVKFATLNLRDEATERNFVSQLKSLGVPISDKTLAINIPFEFDQELERQAQETIDKGMAQAEAMHVLQELCDSQDYAYPADLAQHLQATLAVRSGLAQTEAAEAQNKVLDQQLAQASPAGMMGLLPGTTMQPLAGSGSTDPNPADGATPGPGNPSDATPGQGAPMAAPTAGGSAGVPSDPSALAYGQLTATSHGPRSQPPQAFPPGGEVGPIGDVTAEIPLNRQRPEESDEQRYNMPRQSKKIVRSRRKNNTVLPGRGNTPPEDFAKIANKLKRFKSGPSSYRRSYLADEAKVQEAITRREKEAGRAPSVYDLVHDPNFYALLHAQAYENQLVSDWPEILNGGAPQSKKILDQLIEDYESITGIRPEGS